jgi:hypothetical protein
MILIWVLKAEDRDNKKEEGDRNLSIKAATAGMTENRWLALVLTALTGLSEKPGNRRQIFPPPDGCLFLIAPTI